MSLDLYATRKQKYQNGNIHRNLRVPTSKREGKLSNPRARAPRARDAWRKFTEIYGNPRGVAAREPCIDFAAAKNTVDLQLYDSKITFEPPRGPQPEPDSSPPRGTAHGCRSNRPPSLPSYPSSATYPQPSIAWVWSLLYTFTYV